MPDMIKIQFKQKCKKNFGDGPDPFTAKEYILMTDTKLRKLVLAALFAALTCLMTMVIRVPSPMGGYVNLGDCAVLLSAWVLGPVYGGAAAGVGSMLADLLGYPLYAPGTLVIKGLMAVAAALIFRTLRPDSSLSLPALTVSGVTAEIIMVGGYFLYEALDLPLFMGFGMAAAANIPFNMVQGVFGLVAAGAVYVVLDRSHARARI